jgi:heme o synthase
MLAAQRGLPPIRVLLVTLVGIAFAAASANAIICHLRGHSDVVMEGDFRQVLAAIGRRAIKPGQALTFGITLAGAALILLGLQVSWLSAALAGTTITIFVFIDTLRSSQKLHSGIVVGGTVACFPLLTGWTAVTGTLSLRAIILVIMIFCWAPPRLWVLALESHDGHLDARVPALEAVASASVSAHRILWYSCVVVGATLGLAPYGGWVYTVCALMVGGWFLAEALRLRSWASRISGNAVTLASPGTAAPMRLPGLLFACLAQIFAAVLSVVLVPRGH